MFVKLKRIELFFVYNGLLLKSLHGIKQETKSTAERKTFSEYFLFQSYC